MAGLGDGFMATWRVPQGMSDFTYFRMYFTFFNSNNYRRSITIYPSDNRLNRTGDMFSFAFAGLHSLSSYEDYYSDVYGRGNGSFLITVVGNDDTGYWFSNDVMFTPGVLRIANIILCTQSTLHMLTMDLQCILQLNPLLPLSSSSFG